jgi:hypothetical protein
MSEITEYTGQLIGGPDHGNFVTASVDRIKCRDTLVLWLDGENSSPSTEITDGTYIWQPNEPIPHFKWELAGNGFSKR